MKSFTLCFWLLAGAASAQNTNLPTTLAPGMILRTEWQATGPGNTNVQVSYAVGPDNSFYWDADADAFFTAASITNTAQKAAVNTFVIARKAHGTWDTADRIAVFLGGNSTAHSKYLKGSGTISFTGAPTHDTNGVTFNGSSQYADTGFVPSTHGTNYTLNSDRMLIYVSTNSAYPAASGAVYGGVSSASYTAITYSGTTIYSYGNNALSANSGMGFVLADVRGVFGTTRTSATVGGMYANLSAASGTTDTSTVLPNASIYLGARHWGTGGSELDHYAAFTCSGFEVGAGVDDSTWASIRDDWLAFNNALNR